MAAAGMALLGAMQRPHQPCDVVGSLTRGSAHHRSERFASSSNPTPAILLVQDSTQNIDLDLTLSFEAYATENTTLECQCAS